MPTDQLSSSKMTGKQVVGSQIGDGIVEQTHWECRFESMWPTLHNNHTQKTVNDVHREEMNKSPSFGHTCACEGNSSSLWNCLNQGAFVPHDRVPCNFLVDIVQLHQFAYLDLSLST